MKKLNKRRWWDRDRDSVKKDNSRYEMDVDVVSCFVINIYEFRDVSSIFVIYYDENMLVVDVEGLILELIELFYVVDRWLGDVGLEENLG